MEAPERLRSGQVKQLVNGRGDYQWQSWANVKYEEKPIKKRGVNQKFRTERRGRQWGKRLKENELSTIKGKVFKKELEIWEESVSFWDVG